MRKRKKKAAKKMVSFADFLASGGLEKIKKALFSDDGRIPQSQKQLSSAEPPSEQQKAQIPEMR